jgi:MFS family permease
MSQFLDQFPSTSATLQGLIVSSILITGATASLFAGPLSDRLSRIYTFTIGGLIFAVGSALSASAYKVGQLIVGRLIAGIGEGLFLSSIIVYQCEIAPSAIRGTLACTLQLFVTIGVATGIFQCFALSHRQITSFLLRVFCLLWHCQDCRQYGLAASFHFTSLRLHHFRSRLTFLDPLAQMAHTCWAT